jgi:8-oxo-dGTP diphosphatase
MAAVIRGTDQQVLIAKRPDHVHQGGKWEFPGGKREAGESRWQALCREIYEELGITVETAQPLLQVIHHYPDKSVLLDVWEVASFSGQPVGREGQRIAWVSLQQLDDYEFPAANKPIVSAARLPDRYWITPDPVPHDVALLSKQLLSALRQGIKLIQVRTKFWSASSVRDWLREQQTLFAVHQPIILINSDLLDSQYTTLTPRFPYCHGVHLTSSALHQLRMRPDLPWIAASCHGVEDLQRAQSLGVDFVTLSPVRETCSHPGVPGLGYRAFRELVSTVNLPVYALGGMSMHDLADVRCSGGQGVAGIRALFTMEQ